MSTLFPRNSGMNGPLGSLMPDRFRTLGTGLAEATVGAIVADRKQNQALRWGTMAPGCDGLPNLNTLNDVTCCADNCPEDGTWVLINTQHGIPTLAGGAARPFAGTSGPPVIFRAPMADPCITDVRISLLDTHGNKWRIVEETVGGVRMAPGSLRSTGNTPASPRPTADPNRYIGSFYWVSEEIGNVSTFPTLARAWLQFPSLTGANTDPVSAGSGVAGDLFRIEASGVRISELTADVYLAYYAGLGVQNYGTIGESSRNVHPLGTSSWVYDRVGYFTVQSRGHSVVQGTCSFTGCGRVKSDSYLFGIESPLRSNYAWSESNTTGVAGNLGVMVRDAEATGDELLRPLAWAPIPALYPGSGVASGVYPLAGVPPPPWPPKEMNIFACEDGSVFVNPVGVKTAWQYRYDASQRQLILIRTITLGTGGTAWEADPVLADEILSAVLEY